MSDLRTLYQFELKKMVKKKLLWITAFLMLIAIVFTTTSSLLGSQYVDGELAESHYQSFQTDKKYRKALSGRTIDQQLLDETIDAYRQIPKDAYRYTLTDEYQTYARPYSDIFNLIRSWTGLELSDFHMQDISEENFYRSRNSSLERSWQLHLLTDKEKEFWNEQEARLSIPFTYCYHEGYEIALDCFLTIGILMLFFIAICLSSIFPDEHTRRTDQLILSSAKGKITAYWAKILAGTTVSIFASSLMALITVCLCLTIFGVEGFTTPLQIHFTSYSYPLTMGQACLIAYGNLIITSILAGIFVMVLSELLHSGIATLAISSGLIIMGGLLNIPEQYRALSQLWDSLPMTYLSLWNIFNSRTILLFGHCFVSWQIVPIIYILFSILIVFCGKYVFQRYQISGR